MNLRETVNAILHYQNYEYMPVVSFGYWVETLQKWAQEGHISQEEVEGYTTLGDNSQADRSIMDRLGFDFNWSCCSGGRSGLYPSFERKLLEQQEDGSEIIRPGDCPDIERVMQGVLLRLAPALPDGKPGKKSIFPGCSGAKNG